MMGTMPLFKPKMGMNTKLCSLKYTPNTATAVAEKAMRIRFMPEGHQAAHALHGDAGQTHGVDAANGLGTGAEALKSIWISGFLSGLKNKVMPAPQNWPMTVATAAPVVPDRASPQ